MNAIVVLSIFLQNFREVKQWLIIHNESPIVYSIPRVFVVDMYDKSLTTFALGNEETEHSFKSARADLLVFGQTRRLEVRYLSFALLAVCVEERAGASG